MERPSPFTEDDLLAHIRGEATPETSNEIERAMAESPALRAEIATMQSLDVALKQPDGSAAPGDFAWRRLEAEIRRETTSNQQKQRSVRWRAAAVFLGVAVLGQGAYITWTSATRDGAEFRTVTEAADQHVLAIGLAPGASVTALTALLRQSEGRIVDGPGASGLFRVAFQSAAERDAARALYSASELVDLVADD
ncbi:MAG: hypothetical protein AAGK00_14275 [Pseudomonadota bacterium]